MTNEDFAEAHRLGKKITILVDGERAVGRIVQAFGLHWRLIECQGMDEERGYHASRSSGMGQEYWSPGVYYWLVEPAP